jgi:hypothetical protein
VEYPTKYNPGKHEIAVNHALKNSGMIFAFEIDDGKRK